MWNLVRFFVKNGPFFTWLLLTIVSIFIIGKRSTFHRNIWFTSANAVTGPVLEAGAAVEHYFGLLSINEELLNRMGQLEAENIRLKQALRKYADSTAVASDTTTVYRYTLAHVISNSINHNANYITLDKGSDDGIEQDQGVANQNGVVGVVAQVSCHYSLVISVLNENFRLSASIKNRESFGSLIWDGKSPEYALLEDLPRTVKFERGDTVVTTNYSISFPADIPVGTVVESYETDNSNFLTLRIKLFNDFSRLRDVHVIENADAEERNTLDKLRVGA